MDLQIVSRDASQSTRFTAEKLIIAGWTGRDAAQAERHIAELEKLGVRRPTTVPTFYRLGASLLTTGATIEVVGDDSSGEVEFVLIAADEMLIGVGSDHTDRRLEAVSVAQSKQVCPKPIGERTWRFVDVEDHWDQLELRSFATCKGVRRVYQSGGANRMLHPRALLQRFAVDKGLPKGTVMFCGTLPVEGEISGSQRFEIELHDPVLQRSLRHEYEVHALALVS